MLAPIIVSSEVIWLRIAGKLVTMAETIEANFSGSYVHDPTAWKQIWLRMLTHLDYNAILSWIHNKTDVNHKIGTHQTEIVVPEDHAFVTDSSKASKDGFDYAYHIDLLECLRKGFY